MSKILNEVCLTIILIAAIVMAGLPKIKFLEEYDFVQNFEINYQKNSIIQICFTAFYKNFCLELYNKKNLFNSLDFVTETDTLKTHLKDNNFEGILKNDPLDSLVRGTIIDDLFYGTIWSKQNGNFYIESPKSFLELNYSGLIIYKESSFINDALSKKFLYPRELSRYKINKSFRRRDVSSNERVRKRKFPNDMQVCNFKINVDPFFYQTIFNAEGEKKFYKTVDHIIKILNSLIGFLNDIFNRIKFHDKTKSHYFSGIIFVVDRIKIWTFENCFKIGSKDSLDKIFCSNSTSPLDFISNLAKEDNQNYCLAYTLTGQDFSNGTIGAAWTGVPKSNVGICAKENNSSGTIKTYNTGFITIVNEKCRLTNYQIKLAIAHEVGHSFGALHDQNYDDERCSPSYFKGGDFLMSKKLGDQNSLNSIQFSPCSLEQMSLLMHSLIYESNRFCFKKFNGSICGNGIVEPGEECDCGYFDECLESCCYWADYQIKNKRCKLKENSICSPSQGECCGPECKFKDNSTSCGKSTDNDCNHQRTCSGRSVNCPFDDSKVPDYSMCSLNASLCKGRKCQGSLCEKFNMTKCCLNERSEETSLCHLACQGELTKNVCTDSFLIPEMINNLNQIDLELKTGSKCLNDEGYCDKKKLCKKIGKEKQTYKLSDNTLNLIVNFLFLIILTVIFILIFFIYFKN